MSKKRKNYSGKEKVKVVRLHLVEKMPVSDICDKYDIQPTVYYRWQKQFFERGEEAFKPLKGKALKKEASRIGKLEEKLLTKNEVIAELMEEHVNLKKTLGTS